MPSWFPCRLAGACLLSISLLASAAEAQFGTTGEDIERYRVGPGDLLSIGIRSGASTGEGPETLEVRVAVDGTIDVVHVGKVPAKGNATDRIADRIEQALVDQQIFRRPHVSVNVLEYRSQPVNVSGFVASPGRFYLEGPTNLVDVLSLAGGVLEQEAAYEIIVQREGRSQPITIDRRELLGVDMKASRAANIRMHPRDHVRVPERTEFCVIGPVNSPGCFPYEEDMTIVQAIAQAGGTIPDEADRGKIVVKRNTGGTLAEFPVDLDDSGPAGTEFRVLPDDQVIVGDLELYVHVQGTVHTPGKYDWYDGMTITDAIAEAGGHITQIYTGRLKSVNLFRSGSLIAKVNVKHILNGRAPDVPLEPGDRVYVPRSRM